MRLFLAIASDGLSFDPKTAFKKIRVNLEKKGWEHRWVRTESYHVTLCFIGEVEEPQVKVLSEKLEEVARRHGPFNLDIQGTHAFPEDEMGRVLYVGVQNSKALRSLQEECAQALKELGFYLEDRPYRPHLTVARLRSPRNLIDVLSPLVRHQFGELKTHRLTLFESKQGGAFPLYVPLAHFNLGPQ